MNTFSRVVREAVRHFLQNGYRSPEELAEWTGRIRSAADIVTGTADDYMTQVTSRLTSAYELQVGGARALKRHPGVSRYTLDMLRPQLRTELDRRILASVELIKLNRTKAIDTTLSRFIGWSTSIPPVDPGNVGLSADSRQGYMVNASHIQKSAETVDYEARRVMVDQGHKLIANIDNVIATDQGAIAAVWHSHWKQANYNYREDHKERDMLVYLIKGCWAQKNGYAKPGDAGYLEDITQPGEEVFCRCYVTYIYNLRSLPAECLTQKGTIFLESMRKK